MIRRIISKFKRKIKNTGDNLSDEAVEEVTSRTEEDESNQDNHPSFEIGFSVDEDGNILKSLWQACKNAELAQSQEPKAESLEEFLDFNNGEGREEADAIP